MNTSKGWNVVKGTSFADPEDVRRFKAAKAKGATDQEAFKVGDNGIGCWGDDTTAQRPMCALPREDWNHLGPKARGALVLVSYGGKTLQVELRDTMPARRNIKNGAGIDLNPEACRLLGIRIPASVELAWKWKGETVEPQTIPKPPGISIPELLGVISKALIELFKPKK